MYAYIRRQKARAKRSKRAVSPVIATVILIAIAITISVAVAYWMGGVSGSFTLFEKVEVQGSVCRWDDVKSEWNVEIRLKNTGTTTATLIGVFINNIEVNGYTYTDPCPANASETDMTTSKTIESGATEIVMVYIDEGWESVTSGTTVNIRIHSAGGMDYIKLNTLI